MRLAIIASHPVQYYAPIFRASARRIELTVFYAHQAAPSDQAEAGFGVEFDWDVDLLDGYDHRFLKNVAKVPGLQAFGGLDTPEIGQRLREGQFDAVLLLGWHRKCFIQALIAAKLASIPVMVRGDSHLQTPRSRMKKLAKEMLYPFLLRSFDAALTVGERNRAYWEHYRYPAERMFASPHCVDNEWFAERASISSRTALRKQLGIPPETSLALFAGKLVAFKRPQDVILAAATARSHGTAVEVLIAGSGPLEADLRALAAQHKVPIHLLGFCNQSYMPGAYAAADILMLPSTGDETWGLVANEALACGKPLLLSDAVGCAPDMVASGSAAWSYPSGDTEAAGTMLARILAHPPDAEASLALAQKFTVATAVAGIIRGMSALRVNRPEAG